MNPRAGALGRWLSWATNREALARFFDALNEQVLSKLKKLLMITRYQSFGALNEQVLSKRFFSHLCPPRRSFGALNEQVLSKQS